MLATQPTLINEQTILTYPNELLTKKADKITDIQSLQPILEAMRLYVKDPKNFAVGLALPQVGISQRGFVAQLSLVQKGKERTITEVFLNPIIEITNKRTSPRFESCLSIADTSVEVHRPRALKITYQNSKGERKFMHLSHNNARVIQHEFDHLNGVLITDKGVPRFLEEVSQ